MTIQWTLKTLNIKDLQNHPKNPRQINKDQMHHLENLIAKFGLIDRPIVNLDMVIIGGHQRVKILKKMKLKEVECWVPDRMLDEKEVEHLMVGANLNQGRWDFDILSSNFDVIDLLKYGFSEDQLLGSCAESEEKLGKEDDKKKKTKCCPCCGHEF